MEAFSWSLPFVGEKSKRAWHPRCPLMIDNVTTVTDMLATVLNICTQEELNESADEPSQSTVTIDREKAERRKVIKNKILAVGRISHMFSVLRCVCVVAT